jgi:hypothetical protein
MLSRIGATEDATWRRSAAAGSDGFIAGRGTRIAPVPETYLLFVWTPGGYELREREGEPPRVGEEVEEDGTRLRVSKVGASPLPGDSRPCAFLQG